MTDFIEVELTKWSQIFEFDKHFLSSFIFRGQSDSKWTLETSIERSAKAYSIFGGKGGYEVHERWMMHEFRRKYPLYSSIIPKSNDHFEWLAIMQHHGAPTRLLDFTESLLIATYFALIDSMTMASVWFINRHILRDNLRNNFKLLYNKEQALKDEVDLAHIEFANTFIGNGDNILNNNLEKTIVPLEPKICTERLAKQQGLFLMPTNSSVSFYENMISAFNSAEEFTKVNFSDLLTHSNRENLTSQVKIVKLNISKEIHRDIIHSLKQMNITAEILFPGVDGLAKALQQTHIRLF